jgi:hypothetical protein
MIKLFFLGYRTHSLSSTSFWLTGPGILGGNCPLGNFKGKYAGRVGRQDWKSLKLKKKLFARGKECTPSAPFTPILGNDISSSMEQMLIKRRVIINKNKKQKHVVFYFVVYVCMQQFL